MTEPLNNIFEPFTRQEDSVTNRVQGTGLGMAITKNIIDMMGGIIRVDSIEGKGSRFEVILELKIDKEAEEKQQLPEKKSELPEEEETSLQGMHFLCAEDNELNAEILKALLETVGASCEIYSNGVEIVERAALLKLGECDAILMDIQMPKMNGYEATRRIREGKNLLGREIPIIAMTANAFADDIQQSIDVGMNAHISKPMDLKMLARTMKTVAKS